MTEQAAANAFSPDALKEKYRIEREKRLRSDGNAQYLDLSGVYRDFDADPYVDPGFTRDAVVEELDVAIIGGGFGGLLAGVRLHQQGVTNVRVIEKGGDFGGTWYWNRYPGAACDVESYIYLPMLEEMGYVPTEKYAKAPEIFAYCQSLARKFDLYDGALFQTLVSGADWNEATARWDVTTNRGDKLSAKFLIVAGGLLHKAKLPGIPGIESFKGHSFHTSRWDYGYTGGSPTEPMVKLADKRVGIIGTGATAVQAIPKLAEAAGQLYVFQRTPSNVGVRGNRPTDPEWAKSLQPGWQQRRIENFTAIVTGAPVEEDLIKDGWTEILGGDVPLAATNTDEERRQAADFAKMEAIRARVDMTVKDRATAESLKPWYNAMCKRPCFHDEYLPAFNQPNVTLVDTEGRGVQRITETGVVVGDKEYAVDCLIYASGFEVTTGYTRRLGFEMHGKGGEAITDSWKEGAHTLHGIFTRGFPNLVMFSIIQGGQGINFLHGINELSIHVGEIVSGLLKDDVRTVEPTEAAEQAWMGVIFSFLMATAKFNLECTPSYTNNEGSMGDMATARSAPYMGRTMDYIDILRAWRAEGSLEGLEITK